MREAPMREEVVIVDKTRETEPMPLAFLALFELQRSLHGLENIQDNRFHIIACNEADSIALSGKAREKHIKDREEAMMEEYETEKGRVRGAATHILNSEAVKGRYSEVFGEDEDLSTLEATRAKAAELLGGFYKLYERRLREAEKTRGERDEKKLRQDVAWEVSAIAAPTREERVSETSDWDPEMMKVHDQRKALWYDTVAKLNVLPGEHRKALEAYLKDRNGEAVLDLIESYKLLTNGKIPKRFQRLEMPYDIEDRKQLDAEIQRLETLLVSLQQKGILGEIQEVKETKRTGLSIEKAREAIGRENFLGPEDIQPLLQINLEQVPAIPYSEEELRKARSEGFMLVLRMDKDKDGRNLTGARLNELLQARMPQGSTLLYNSSGAWYRTEQFYTTETCKAEWKLVTAECIPNSFSQNYSDQTRTVRDMARVQGVLTPAEESECTDALLRELAQMAERDATWQDAARRLSELKVNQNHRPKFVESLWDKALTFIIHQRRNLPNTVTWSSSRSSSGSLVYVGDFNENGLDVYNWGPGRRHVYLGVSFSR